MRKTTRITTLACGLLLMIIAMGHTAMASGKPGTAEQYKMPLAYIQHAESLHKSLRLQELGLDKDIFIKAYKGYLYLLTQGVVSNTQMLSIADFSQSSRNKRLYVINLQERKLVFHTYVSHGKNSGADMATSFSNVNNSFKSTLGFLITADTYQGSNGYSLKFQGMEAGINDLVTYRNIVVHGSRYVNEQKIAKDGQPANSLGCPAVPMAQSKPLIDAIKGGSVYFIYHPDEYYAAASPILNARMGLTLHLPINNPFLDADTLAPGTER